MDFTTICFEDYSTPTPVHLVPATMHHLPTGLRTSPLQYEEKEKSAR
jgi:hypothetical protein